MKLAVVLLVSCDVIFGAIRESSFFNKLLSLRPAGKDIQVFVPLTDIPPPPGRPTEQQSGRRHLEVCEPTTEGEVYVGSEATVIMPDHIDHKHFEVTSPVPYLTVGPIDGVGFHGKTLPPMDACEKIYQDHLATLYSDEDYTSQESLEIARVNVDDLRSLERAENEDV
ncbi:uncharacterized protein LOC121732402 [Aricia agestis]|uniref:uncharacterized protein LOC121732402 n=1 Tax=Aricia agestis TaxID=91739 RepID=UPI001C202291|nr:uncharacterized protein LOC121732402 [Aricia agestis]